MDREALAIALPKGRLPQGCVKLLKQVRLEGEEDVMTVTARLAVEPASMKIKAERLVPVKEAMRYVLETPGSVGAETRG